MDFGIGPRSDHPILYVDISLTALCNLPPQSINNPTHPSSRNLWSTDIKAAEIYVDLVKHDCKMENIATQIAILKQRCDQTNRCTQNDEKILNKIDRGITKIMLRAERDCKRAKGHAWSSLLAQAGKMVIAAKWHLSDVLLGQIPIPPGSRAEMLQHARQQVKEAYAALGEVQQNARAICNQFLEDHAEHLAETQNMSKAAALCQLLHAERQCAIFRCLGV
jgi:hypothetical protein